MGKPAGKRMVCLDRRREITMSRVILPPTSGSCHPAGRAALPGRHELDQPPGERPGVEAAAPARRVECRPPGDLLHRGLDPLGRDLRQGDGGRIHGEAVPLSGIRDHPAQHPLRGAAAGQGGSLPRHGRVIDPRPEQITERVDQHLPGFADLKRDQRLNLAMKATDYLLEKSLDAKLSREVPSALDEAEQTDERLSMMFKSMQGSGIKQGPAPSLLESIPVGVSLTVHFSASWLDGK